MDIRLLEAFRAVIESGSVTHAANALGVTQPAVSAQIARLEGTLGFALFERVGNRLRPTAEAVAFRADVDQTLARIDDLARAAALLRSGDAGTLAIASHPMAGITLLPPVVSAFARKRPDVRIQLLTRNSDVVRGMFPSRLLDIGISELPVDPTGISVTRYRMECVAILPNDHALAAQEVITPEMMSGLPFVGMSREWSLYHVVADGLRRSRSRSQRRRGIRTLRHHLQPRGGRRRPVDRRSGRPQSSSLMSGWRSVPSGRACSTRSRCSTPPSAGSRASASCSSKTSTAICGPLSKQNESKRDDGARHTHPHRHRPRAVSRFRSALRLRRPTVRHRGRAARPRLCGAARRRGDGRRVPHDSGPLYRLALPLRDDDVRGWKRSSHAIRSCGPSRRRPTASPPRWSISVAARRRNSRPIAPTSPAASCWSGTS